MPEQRRPRSLAVRFLTIPQVAEELATSEAQITALVQRGDPPALQLGGRGQWRIERAKLEEFITRAYEEIERYIAKTKRHHVDQDIGDTNPLAATG